MILYHTSDKRIEHPDISFSRAYLDFGKGIYTTPSRLQAEKYAKRFFKEERPVFLNIFEFDDEVEGLRITRSTFTWLTLLIARKPSNVSAKRNLIGRFVSAISR